jgi:hypothetical protein
MTLRFVYFKTGELRISKGRIALSGLLLNRQNAFLGITSIGAIAVALNAWWQGEELEYGLTDSGGRIKDMILRGGENIYCAEIESVLYDQLFQV